MTLLHPHPALKAVSEQASPVDQWMNDDDHRYGALRESYDFEYAVMEQADKNKNTHFEFETYDTYSGTRTWARSPTSTPNTSTARFPTGTRRSSTRTRTSSGRRRRGSTSCTPRPVPNLNVAGFWDQEDPWGPWQIFRHARRERSRSHELHGRGPMVSTANGRRPRRQHWHRPFGGHETAREFRETIEAPFFRYYLHGTARSRRGRPHVPVRLQQMAHVHCVAAQGSEADQPLLPRRRDALVHGAHRQAAPPIVNIVSDPANPVPYRSGRSRRPIRPATGARGKSPTSGSSITP